MIGRCRRLFRSPCKKQVSFLLCRREEGLPLLLTPPLPRPHSHLKVAVYLGWTTRLGAAMRPSMACQCHKSLMTRRIQGVIFSEILKPFRLFTD